MDDADDDDDDDAFEFRSESLEMQFPNWGSWCNRPDPTRPTNDAIFPNSTTTIIFW